MTKKISVFLVFTSLLFAQMMFSPWERTAAATDTNAESLALAEMLPDSEIMATMDFNRILNIAAPNILNQDAKKIGHLKELVKTIENTIGLNPYEIRQVAFGINIPTDMKAEKEDSILKANPVLIVRTQNPNQNLLDNWAKKLDMIGEFENQKMPSRQYMDVFKELRNLNPEPVKAKTLATTTEIFEDTLKKTQDLDNALNALPKLNTDPAAVVKLRENNKQIAALTNRYLDIVKTDVNTENYREQTIKLLNRFNAVTLDDAQRIAKLDAILKESKAIYVPYQKKSAAAATLKALLASTGDETEKVDSDETKPAAEKEIVSFSNAFAYSVNAEVSRNLDSVIAALGVLPKTRLKRTEQLKTLSESMDTARDNFNTGLETITPSADAIPTLQIETPDATAQTKKNDKTMVETLRLTRAETVVNNKKMQVFDLGKLAENVPAENKTKETPATEKPAKSIFDFKIAVGYLDDRTMAIGFEKTVAEMLNRDPAYKNAKVQKMLGAANNSLAAFAVDSKIYSSIMAGANPPPADAKPPISSSFEDALMEKLVKNVSFYGSINYDEAGGNQLTNDITMSFGMFKEKMDDLVLPDETTDTAGKEQDADDTFELGGFVVGKDIFYDLFNSFKAVQMSVTFKFEQKKLAKLVRSTPKIINAIIANRKESKSPAVAAAKNAPKEKPTKLTSIQDLITAPQLYIDLAKLLSGQS